MIHETPMIEPKPLAAERLDTDSCWALLERVAASAHLKRATRLKELLLYVGQCSLKDGRDQVREQEIGSRVFGRPDGYDTSIDNIVRTNVSDLRKRVETYFKTEGSHEPITMEIPRGSYLPVFRLREPDVEIETEADPAAETAAADARSALAHNAARRRWSIAAAIAACVTIAALAAGCLILWIQLRSIQRAPSPWKDSPAVAEFWEPLLREKGDVLICSGGNVLAPNALLGVATAEKNVAYPYFSVTTVSSVALLSPLIKQGGATPQFAFAATTSLPQFHEHPVILLNAYNNHWAQRLAEPLRFHFAPDVGPPGHSILDRSRPNVIWKRDPSIPYDSADDYALVARFWDSTTDNWVLILAGLGRNGTEAAAQFATSPQYLELLRQQAGKDFANRNIEAVLKMSVIEGKTGAPSIVAVHVW
jgi:hypothetical protein